MDVVKFIHKDRLIVRYTSSGTNQALAQKIEILAVFADKLLKRNFNTRVKVFLDYEKYYTSTDSTSFTLGYNEFSYSTEKKDSKHWNLDSGIVIVIRDRSFSIAQALNLIQWAINNTATIKKHQTLRTLPTLSKNTSCYSIPYYTILSIAKTNDTLVNSLIKTRQDQIEIYNSPPYPTYFYENDKFHILHGDTVVHIFSDLIHIINLNYADYLAFVNDSTFYYKKWTSEFKGPFIIQGFKNIGPIEYKCLTTDSIDTNATVTLYITFGLSEYSTKALFVPFLNRVFSRYDTLENYYLKQIVTANKSTTNSTSLLDFKTISIYLVLVFSLSLNALLFVRRNK